MRAPFGGLSAFEDAVLSGGAGFRIAAELFTATIKLDGGRNTGKGVVRFFVAGSVPIRIELPSPGKRLLLTAGYRYGMADDNPAAARMGVNKRTAYVDAGVGVRGWELHGTYQYRWYAPVHRDQYQPLLADSAFFTTFHDILNPARKMIDAPTAPIPANEVHQVSAYFFGPVAPVLYLGGSFSYTDAAHDNYIPLADTDSGDVICGFFPYQTPHHEGSLGVVAQLVHHCDQIGSVLNDASLKIEFPAYSFGTYRGYYLPPSGSLLAGFTDFYYDYQGTGTLTVAAKIGKLLPADLGISLSYVWVSKPYVAYRFFGTDSYQYHTVAMRIEKKF